MITSTTLMLVLSAIFLDSGWYWYWFGITFTLDVGLKDKICGLPLASVRSWRLALDLYCYLDLKAVLGVGLILKAKISPLQCLQIMPS